MRSVIFVLCGLLDAVISAALVALFGGVSYVLAAHPEVFEAPRPFHWVISALAACCAVCVFINGWQALTRVRRRQHVRHAAVMGRTWDAGNLRSIAARLASSLPPEQAQSNAET